MKDKLKIFCDILGEDYDKIEEEILVEELEHNVYGEELELLVSMLDEADTDRYEERASYPTKMITLVFDNGLELTFGKGFAELV